MKFTYSFVVLFYFVIVVNCYRLPFLRSRRDSQDEDSPSGPFSSSIAGDLGFKDLMRETQIKFLGATESLLDHSSEIYENFQEALGNLNKEHEQKSSDVKKALRYLKTEARRLREDIEDEIEVEKEKAEEAAAASAEKKKSKQNIKKLNAALKKLDEVSATKINKQKIENKKNKVKTEAGKKIDQKVKELTTIIPAVMSLGDGFGRHM